MVAARGVRQADRAGLPDRRGRARGIHGDAARLRQVLLNLLSNAVKFTESGEVVVHVDAERRPARGGRTFISRVQDTGIGISRDKLRRCFEPFVQADASTTRRYGGTVLGLAISKRLVERMGGMELAGLEPAASWVRSRRSPN